MREGRTEERKYLPADAAIARLRGGEAPVTLEFLESCAMHPDERVVVELLGFSAIQSFVSEAETICQQVVRRIVREARSRGEVWNLLLDRLSMTLWAADDLLPGALEKEGRQDHYLDTVVVPRVRRQTDAQVLRALILEAESDPLACCIARTAITSDVPLPDAI